MADTNVRLDNFAHFGDGNTALVLRRRKTIKEDGITYWEFFFAPTRRLIGMYNLKDEINPVDGSIRREYAEVEVEVVDENPNHLRIWVFADFEGGPTPVGRRDEEKDMQILNLQKKNSALQLECSELQSLLKKRAVPELYIKQAANAIREARTAAAKMKTGGDGDVSSDDEDEE